MIYEAGECPYFRQFIECGFVMATPNYSGSPKDRAVVIDLEWDDDKGEEEVSHQLETWAGLPGLEWFRFYLRDVTERSDYSTHLGMRIRKLRGCTDAATALDLKRHTADYPEPRDWGPNDG